MLKNIIIKSTADRNLFGVTIKQQADTGMLCLTDLKESYMHGRVEKGWGHREITDFVQYRPFQEKVYYTLKELGFMNKSIHLFIENIESKGFIKYMKELGVYKTKGTRAEMQIYCNPYLWVMFAMELNPEIYAKVVIWLTDDLLFNRLEACSNYREMNEQIKDKLKLDKDDYLVYVEVATLINTKVFGKHINGIRNLATKDQLKLINKIEVTIADLLRIGMLKDFKDIKNLIYKI
jgi:hypothetical protein